MLGTTEDIELFPIFRGFLQYPKFASESTRMSGLILDLISSGCPIASAVVRTAVA